MLRIAVPNKGSLSGPAAEMLHEAGYRQRRESKELRIVDPGNEVEFFYLRPRDIAIYVSSGRLDIARRTTASNDGGAVTESSEGAGGSVLSALCMIADMLPSNGRSPVSNWYSRTPEE